MAQAIVSEKGWIVIPKEMRDKLGLKKGSKVQIVEFGGMICMEKVLDDPIAASAGMFAGGPSMTQALLEDRREEEERRDRKFAPHFPEALGQSAKSKRE